jgi:hypothetical protein
VLLVLIGSSIPASRPAHAQQGAAVLFQNVRIFDGKGNALSAPLTMNTTTAEQGGAHDRL